MAISKATLAPAAHLTLRAHPTAPARVELLRRSWPNRLLRSFLWIAGCWGVIPLLLWVPPHYPWIVGSFCAGLFFGHRSWTGRYRVGSFAGICPRCGNPLSLGIDRVIDLPHTLTCFNCHFEPQLRVDFARGSSEIGRILEHQRGDCVGLWSTRWLADAEFVYCEDCRAGAAATPEIRALSRAENERAELLQRLADEGWPLI